MKTFEVKKDISHKDFAAAAGAKLTEAELVYPDRTKIPAAVLAVWAQFGGLVEVVELTPE